LPGQEAPPLTKQEDLFIVTVTLPDCLFFLSMFMSSLKNGSLSNRTMPPRSPSVAPSLTRTRFPVSPPPPGISFLLDGYYCTLHGRRNSRCRNDNLI